MEVSKIGDKITWNISFTNNGPEVERNAKITDTLPAGLAYVTHSISKGTFDKNTGVATIGYMAVGETVTLKLTYIVEDIGEAVEYPEDSGEMGFLNTVVVSGDNVDPNNVNNTTSQFTAITTCPPSAGGMDVNPACYCLNLMSFVTKCTDGSATTVRMVTGSAVNIKTGVGGFALPLDGMVNINGFILNPYEEASFEYVVDCGALQTAGPYTMTFPPLFGENYTDELVDNLDGSFTHTAMDGTEVTFNTLARETVSVVTITASVTTITQGNFANHYKIDDSDGSAKVINLPLPSTLLLPAGYSKSVTFKRINNYTSPGSITISAPVGATIDGVSTYVFPATNMTSITLFTDGINYFIK